MFVNRHELPVEINVPSNVRSTALPAICAGTQYHSSLPLICIRHGATARRSQANGCRDLSVNAWPIDPKINCSVVCASLKRDVSVVIAQLTGPLEYRYVLLKLRKRVRERTTSREGEA